MTQVKFSFGLTGNSCYTLARCAVGAVAMAVFASVGLAQSTFVPGTANIFGYGVGTPQPGGGGGGTLAPLITLTPGTGRVMTFSATGTAFSGAGAPPIGPDGGNFSITSIPAVGSISGFAAPLRMMLVGVFVETGDISLLPAPGSLSYPDLASLAQPMYSPSLRQVFHIGDGLTGTGTGMIQQFNVPDGAGKLVFGIADAFSFQGLAGWYDDNSGGYTVNYSIPAPGVFAAFGACALLARRRRR
jgi:hypothetical protein